MDGDETTIRQVNNIIGNTGKFSFGRVGEGMRERERQRERERERENTIIGTCLTHYKAACEPVF